MAFRPIGKKKTAGRTHLRLMAIFRSNDLSRYYTFKTGGAFKTSFTEAKMVFIDVTCLLSFEIVIGF
jgi:hypothetical protein